MITDWLMVVITSVYVIATILICVFNAKTAKAAREQITQSSRPRITAEIVLLKRLYWSLRFTNCGGDSAYNFRFELAQGFIDSLSEPLYRQRVISETQKVKTIGVLQTYDVIIGGNCFNSSQKRPPLIGQIEYKDGKNNEYSEEFEIEVENYATFYSVDSEMEDIKHAITEQNAEIKRIRQVIEHYYSSTNRTDNPSLSEYLGLSLSSNSSPGGDTAPK